MASVNPALSLSNHRLSSTPVYESEANDGQRHFCEHMDWRREAKVRLTTEMEAFPCIFSREALDSEVSVI